MEGKISKIKTIQLKCKKCGADLEFAPGMDSTECKYCGTLNRISDSTKKSVKEDYRKILSELEKQEEFIESYTAECKTCGALFEVDGDISSTECPFCASPVVVEGGSTRRIKPKAIIPFGITAKEAKDIFGKWISKLWFAPSELKDSALLEGKPHGIYTPSWSYDMNSISYYDGERGDDHSEEETYTTFEKGKEVTKTNTITVTNWTPASGVIFHAFSDILIPATDTIPGNLLRNISQWDVKKAMDFKEEYLSGFTSECYRINVVEGFNKAVTETEKIVKELIREDIGGDHQKINSIRTSYDKIKFKHLLFPLWISTYKFRKKTYRFLINGSTGKIHGERPWSLKKIFTLIFSLIAIIVLIVLIT